LYEICDKINVNIYFVGGRKLNPIIEIKNLRKEFVSGDKKVVALDNINLNIQKGDIYGIIGLSGAGKSTLVRCINFLEVPTSGQVIFEGKDLQTLSKKDLLLARRSMGMIFQRFNLLAQRTALKNICYPMEIAGISKAAAKKRALELLEVVGLPDKANSYPAQLSGGQMQRIAIARALATNPQVLLCDEATSALDPNTTNQILELLKEINHIMGVTIIVITHEMRVIEQICNRVAVIDHSNIVEEGFVKDVFLRPQSTIARNLILPKGEAIKNFEGKRCIRIVFDGNSSYEPIISNMTLESRAAVNIMFANTKNIDGKAFGEMVIQLPPEEAAATRILDYLESANIFYREEDYAE